ncbi:MAG TPA: hypothetical protein VLE54_06700, partial [Thermoanaerobaculia bacterium]|nr:hypothetical protein [Thermoanaerobaculia bacterium]
MAVIGGLRARALRLASTLRTRWQLAAQLDGYGGRRDFNRALGYPDDSQLTYETFYRRYTRDPLAKRIIDLAPDATWSGGIEITENDDQKVMTEFETDVAALALRTKLFSQFCRL